MVSSVFHPLSELGVDAADNAKFRAFVVAAGERGQGTPFLELPGCTAVHRVRVGGVELEPTRTDHVIVQDGDPPKYQDVVIPNWQLDAGANGVPVLRRSILSNDGFWQSGTVYVDGDFAEEKPAKAKPADAPAPTA